eukprot:12915418-Prorocentrum_lima.AAC.1
MSWARRLKGLTTCKRMKSEMFFRLVGLTTLHRSTTKLSILRPSYDASRSASTRTIATFN